MIEDYLNQSGFRVDLGTWLLYDSAPSASPITLTGTAPTVSFRCRATVTSVTGHTDCTGTLMIGSETLTFTVTGQKRITTTILSSLPAVTYSGLDCRITIECIDSGGAAIREETQTTLNCRFQDTQKSFRLPSGEFSLSDAIAYTNDSSCAIGSKISYGGYDYGIAQVAVMTGLDGSEEGRKLWLTGKAVAPSGRTVVDVNDYMTKSVYDPGKDGVVDKAEGIPVLAEVPADLSGYADGDMFKVGDRIYVVHIS